MVGGDNLQRGFDPYSMPFGKGLPHMRNCCLLAHLCVVMKEIASLEENEVYLQIPYYTPRLLYTNLGGWGITVIAA